MVISELLQNVTEELTLSGSDNAHFEAVHLICFVLNISRKDLILNSKNAVSKEEKNRILALLKRRICGEPFQYILGTQEFMSLEFAVTPDTLIPRQDTETLVELVLSETENLPLSLLDIGTGTGCIPISLAHFKDNFNCVGIDISENALKIAKKNAETLNLSDRVTFEKCDILTDYPNKKFDIVVSNPPYIKSEIIPTLQTEVRDFEPILALDGGIDGLKFYRRICDILPKILKTGGFFALEIGFDQGQDVLSLMETNFEKIKIIKDLSGNDRVISGYLK